MDLSALARLQAGVFTRGQARASGLSDNQINVMLASGRWRSYFPNRRAVFSDATLPRSREAHMWAALLAVGEPCALALTSAAATWRWCDQSGITHIAVPRRRRVTAPPGARIHRLTMKACDVTRKGRLQMTTPGRTLSDCLRFLPLRPASEILDRSQQLNGPTLEEVAAQVPVHGPGTAQARTILRAADQASFAAERLAVKLLKEAGITGWASNLSVSFEGRKAKIDIAFPGLRLAIEIDGFAFHHKPPVFRGDRKRQNAVMIGEWRVLRYTWLDLVEEPERFIAEVRAMITLMVGEQVQP